MKKKKFTVGFSSLLVLGLFLFVSGCKSDDTKETAKPLEVKPTKIVEKTLNEYTFETGTDKWASRGKAKVEQSSEKKHGGNSSLKISGTSAEPYWNYAASPMFDLEPNKSYRLSGWMLVESVSDPKFAPHFKCGITGIGNKDTKTYNLDKKNEWQELSVEFTTPATASKGEVAVEKGNDKNMEASIFIDDVKIDIIK